MFIEESDLLTKIRLSDLKQIVGEDQQLIAHSISYAIGEIKPYLAKYDTEKLFSAIRDNREPLLVAFAVDIAIYELIALARPNIDTTDRRERRNRAIGYLQAVRDDNLPTGWDLAPPPPVRESPVFSKSTPSRGNYF